MEDSLAQNGGCNGRIGKPKTINLRGRGQNKFQQ